MDAGLCRYAVLYAALGLKFPGVIHIDFVVGVLEPQRLPSRIHGRMGKCVIRVECEVVTGQSKYRY